MPDANVEIIMAGHGRGTVLINGKEVPAVRAIRFESHAGGVNVVTLEIFAAMVNITGPVEMKTEQIDVTSIASIAREYEK